MQSTPAEIEKYLAYSPEKLGTVLVDDAPPHIREATIQCERDFYSKTSRRRIINLDIDEENIEFVYDKLLKEGDFEPAQKRPVA